MVGPMAKLEWGEGREAFILLRNTIETELRKGRSKRAVWSQFQDQLKIGYRGFSRLSERYIGTVLPTHTGTARPASIAASGWTGQASPEADGRPPTAIRTVSKVTDRPKLEFTNKPDVERIRRLLRRAEPDPVPE